MGARARLRDLGRSCRRGCRASASRRALAGDGLRPGRPGDRPRRRVVVVLLRGDRDRQEPVPEGRLGRVGARLPVRLDEPRLGARARAVGPDRLAVHARRVRRRARDDRPDVGCCCGCSSRRRVEERGARARAATPTPATSTTRPARELPLARAADARRSAWSDVAHNFRGDWQMLWKEIALGFLLAGFIALLGDDFFNGLFLDDAPAAVQTIVGRVHRPGDRGAELRLLGRQRPAGRRAVVGRHLASPA